MELIEVNNTSPIHIAARNVSYRRESAAEGIVEEKERQEMIKDMSQDLRLGPRSYR